MNLTADRQGEDIKLCADELACPMTMSWRLRRWAIGGQGRDNNNEEIIKIDWKTFSTKNKPFICQMTTTAAPNCNVAITNAI